MRGIGGCFVEAGVSRDAMVEVTRALIGVLPDVEAEMVRNGALAVARTLALVDLDGVLLPLLQQPLPLQSAALTIGRFSWQWAEDFKIIGRRGGCPRGDNGRTDRRESRESQRDMCAGEVWRAACDSPWSE